MGLGGWYALNFAVHHPGRVSALSLISTGGIAPQRAGFLFKALFFLMFGTRGHAMLNKAIYHKSVMPEEVEAVHSQFYI